MEELRLRGTKEGDLMPVGEVLKVVSEVAKETSREIARETKTLLKDLDKPLSLSEIQENVMAPEESFDDMMKDLDEPLNSEKDKVEKLEQSDGADGKKEEKSNLDKGEKQGGRFGDIFKEGEGENVEVHHMPADSVTELSRNDGPAIKMDKEDHRETASCGNSKEAREYREQQKELIDAGKFEEAIQMDIDDIREKFGDKYDEAISQMLEYVEQLKEEGKI